MKKIASLSAKYMRRQKMRTALTFCSIVLSVFIFMTLCNAFIVLRGLLLGNGIPGHEAELHLWLDQYETDEERAQAVEMIRNHIAVDDAYIYHGTLMYADGSRDENGFLSYYTVQTDKGDLQYYTSLHQQQQTGNFAMIGEAFYMGMDTTDLKPNEIILPNEYKDLGYQIGDTVTLTITPCVGKISDDAECIKEMVDDILAHAEPDALETHDLFRDSAAGDSGRNSLAGGTLFQVAHDQYFADRVTLEFEDVTKGTPVILTYTVKDFALFLTTNLAYMPLVTGYGSDGSLSALEIGGESALSAWADKFDIPYIDSYDAFITVPKNLNFDKAMEQLFDDLKVPYSNNDPEGLSREELIYPANASDLYNVERLEFEFRGTVGIANWLINSDGDEDKYFELLLIIFLTFLVWLIMRFVIDNAFEISVQERSAQFATLRIMGATRRQITALVGTEALIYSVIAIPLGTFFAFLAKHAAIATLEGFGLTVERPYFLPLTCIGILLALLAVFISAYTSSMWAAHAYAPLDAAKRTRLKGNKKETIWNKALFGTKTKDEKIEAKLQKEAARRNPAGGLKTPKKSKLDRKQKSFLRNYTWRNIRRSKRRFAVSVTTMAIGVLLFTLGASLGGFAAMIVKNNDLLENLGPDFYVDSDYTPEFMEYVEQHFEGNSDYRAVEARLYSYLPVDQEAIMKAGGDIVLAEDLTDPYPDSITGCAQVSTDLMNRGMYDHTYAESIGMTYDELTAAGGAVLVMSEYGSYQRWNTDFMGRYVSTNGQTYTPGYYPLKETVSVPTPFGTEVPVIGVLIEEGDKNLYGSEMLIGTYPLKNVIFGDSEDSDLVIQGEYSTSVERRMMLELYLKDGTVYDSAKTEISNFQQMLTEKEPYVYVQDNYLFSTGFSLIVRAIVISCALVLLAVWLTGIFTMINTINTGVLNRCDELMMLRTVGMTRKQLRRIIASESRIYCNTATLIGGILGISATLFFATMLSAEMSIPLWQMFAIVFGVLIVTLLLNQLIAGLAARPSLRALDERMERGGMLQ